MLSPYTGRHDPRGGHPEGPGRTSTSAGEGADPTALPGGSPIGWPHGEGLRGETPQDHHDPGGAVTLVRAARQAGWLLGTLTGSALRANAAAARSAGRLLDVLAERAVGR